LVWAKAIGNRQYYSRVIWVPMILLLANKNILNKGPGSFFMKSQDIPYNHVSLKI
jgi:hypothetical protein